MNNECASISLFHIRNGYLVVAFFNPILSRSWYMFLPIRILNSKLNALRLGKTDSWMFGLHKGHRLENFIGSNIWLLGLFWFPT